jgi:DNA-binding CsgD family transcriptional regulator
VPLFEEFVEHSEAATTVCQLRSRFRRVMADEGFENHFIGRLIGRKVVEADWVEFPEGHFETYLAEDWEDVDPILAYTAMATRPFCWDDVSVGMQFTRDQTALLDECKRVGVHSIIVAPFHNPNGGCDIVGVSRRQPGQPDRARIAILQAICVQTWCRYADLDGSAVGNGHREMTLTNRELEILRWLKDGKSNSETSQIMGLSIKTIEYHVGNILKKLGAANRTTAVVIAIRRRLLDL